VEVTSPFPHIGADGDHPVLTLIVVSFVMAAILLIPAGAAAVRRGALAIRDCFTAMCIRRRLSSAWDRDAARVDFPRGHHGPGCSEDHSACACEWSCCQHPLQDDHGLPLKEKIRLTLSHPEPENRMLAADWLGELGGFSALRERVAKESDPRVVIVVARAAARIGGDEAKKLLTSLKSHPSATVREVAGRLCEDSDLQEARRLGAEDLSPRDDRMAFQ
jgi:hypothetical protein